MKKISLGFSIVLCFLFIFNCKISAIYDPLSVPNNKYGIHIIDENDLDNAASLVNSSGGDYGYVTLVITKDDQNIEKWQAIFDRMRNLHLIPIIRLATKLNFDTWEKPLSSDALGWSEFLDRLNWATTNRYVIIFNEPNHSKEWGGFINPSEYASVLASYSATLKSKSDKFFVLPAGLDASAPNSAFTMDETRFLRGMVWSNKNIFSSIDGWTSHSYPNPGFRGKPIDKGRGTISNYLWELNLLKSFGFTGSLPVFITETGWPHKEESPTNQSYYPSAQIADFIVKTANTVWLDPQIVALTPFVLNYQSYPFLQFSWQKRNSQEFYAHYHAYQSLAKTAGAPTLEEENAQVKGITIQPSITSSPIQKDFLSIRLASFIIKPIAFIKNVLKPIL